jgi:hypothetical protein
VLTIADLEALAATAAVGGLVRETTDAVFRPVDPLTKKRSRRTLAEYFAGRDSKDCAEYLAMRDTLKMERLFLSDFGLTPASKGKVTMIPPKESAKDRMEELVGQA